MVASIDAGILGHFTVIFTFIMVFVIVYGFLSLTKVFGSGKNGLYAIIAFSFAILSITSSGVLALITFITPWFFVLIFIGFFVLFVLMMFGLKSEDLTAGKTSELRVWVIILTAVILIFGLGAAFGQQALEEGTGGSGTTPPAPPVNASLENDAATDDFATNVMEALFNPKLLGMVVVMLVGAFAMFLLTKSDA